ncbi:MAG: STY0301 family protein [Terriglobales bacterium]
MKRAALLLAGLFFAIPTVSVEHATTGELACPESVAGKGVAAGTAETSSRARHAFERFSAFNRDRDGQEYDLAPDLEWKEAKSITQTWKLHYYRDLPLFLRCRYHDTDETLDLEVPQKITQCILTFQLDRRKEFTGKTTMRCS